MRGAKVRVGPLHGRTMKQQILHLSLALAFAACSAPSLAQAQPPAATTAPASGRPYSIDTKLSDLLADPRAAEVVKTFVRERRAASGKPDLTAEQQARLIARVRFLTPREVSQFPQANMDDAALAVLAARLAQIPASASASARAAADDPGRG